MASSTEYDILDIKDDIVNRLRAGLQSFDSQARTEQVTTNFSGNGASTLFILDTDRLSYVVSVTVNSVVQTPFTQYRVLFRGTDKGKIQFTSAPASGTNNIVVVWGRLKVGKSNWIHSDFPRTDISIDSCPRIGFELTVKSDMGGFNSAVNAIYLHELLIQCKIVHTQRTSLDQLGTALTTFMKTHGKKFTFFSWLKPSGTQPADNYADNSDQTFSTIHDFVAPQKYEVRTYA